MYRKMMQFYLVQWVHWILGKNMLFVYWPLHHVYQCDIFCSIGLRIPELFYLWNEGRFIFTVLAAISVCPPYLSLPAPYLHKHGSYCRHLQSLPGLVKPEDCWVHRRSTPLNTSHSFMIIFVSCFESGGFILFGKWWCAKIFNEYGDEIKKFKGFEGMYILCQCFQLKVTCLAFMVKVGQL